MKREGWFTHTPWEWERTKEVVILAIDDKVSNVKPSVIKELRVLIGEFSIPIDITDGNFKHNEDLQEIQILLRDSTRNAMIDYEQFERNLRNVRDKGRLPYGVVILIDKNRYEFYNPPSQKDRAIYGIGVSDGLVILRHAHKEAVRHEFGHMLGLPHHDPPKSGCIMNWQCDTPIFCDECKRRIGRMWQDEIKGK